jgi:hypothetical protein
VFQLIRAAAARLFRPGGGAHRQHPPGAEPLTRTSSTAQPLRAAHHAVPYVWTDDGPLLRPYVLSREEWTRRRSEGGPQASRAAS